jgi:hypothetical protein
MAAIAPSSAPASSGEPPPGDVAQLKSEDELERFAAISGDGKTIALPVSSWTGDQHADSVELVPVGGDHGDELPAAKLDEVNARLAAGAFHAIESHETDPMLGTAPRDFVRHDGKRVSVHYDHDDKHFLFRHDQSDTQHFPRVVFATPDLTYFSWCDGGDAKGRCSWTPVKAGPDEPEPPVLSLTLPALSADGKTLAVVSEAWDEEDGERTAELIPVGHDSGDSFAYEGMNAFGSEIIHDDKVDALEARFRAGAFKPISIAEWKDGDDVQLAGLQAHAVPGDRHQLDVTVKGKDGKQIAQVIRRGSGPTMEMKAEALVVVSDAMAYLRYNEGEEYPDAHWLAIPLGGPRTTAITVGLPAVSSKLDTVAVPRSGDVIAFLPMGKIAGEDVKVPDDAAVAKVNARLASGGFQTALYGEFDEDAERRVDDLRIAVHVAADKRHATVEIKDGDQSLATQKIDATGEIVPVGAAVLGRMFVYVRYRVGDGPLDAWIAIPLS